MMGSVEIVCPHCGLAGSAKARPREGATVRCARCKGEFAYHSPAEEPVRFEEVETPAQGSDLEKRIGRLERRNRLLAAGLVLSWVLCGAAWAFPRAASNAPATSPGGDVVGRLGVGELIAEKVYAREVQVVDDRARPLAVLDARQGFGSLTLKNTRGPWTSEVDSTGIRCVNGRGKVRAGLAATDVGGASLFLRGEDGSESVSLSGDRDPGLILVGEGEQAVLQMGIRGSKPFLDHRGNTRTFTGMIP